MTYLTTIGVILVLGFFFLSRLYRNENVKNRIFTILSVSITFLLCQYNTNRVAVELSNEKQKLQDANTEIAHLYDFSQRKEVTHGNNEHHVLCLGNSITWHPYRAEIEWFSEHGMAASSPEKDYCHVLESKMKTLNARSTVTGINIADWELNFNSNLDSIIGKDITNGKDIIIIRIGENVRDIDNFEKALNQLIEYCKRTTDNIIVTGNVWENAQKETALIRAAYNNGLTYIPLYWIMKLYPNTYPQVGDTLYDTNGSPYTINKPFICSHPNDMGMKMIAEAIFNQLPL